MLPLSLAHCNLAIIFPVVHTHGSECPHKTTGMTGLSEDPGMQLFAHGMCFEDEMQTQRDAFLPWAMVTFHELGVVAMPFDLSTKLHHWSGIPNACHHHQQHQTEKEMSNCESSNIVKMITWAHKKAHIFLTNVWDMTDCGFLQKQLWKNLFNQSLFLGPLLKVRNETEAKQVLFLILTQLIPPVSAVHFPKPLFSILETVVLLLLLIFGLSKNISLVTLSVTVRCVGSSGRLPSPNLMTWSIILLLNHPQIFPNASLDMCAKWSFQKWWSNGTSLPLRMAFAFSWSTETISQCLLWSGQWIPILSIFGRWKRNFLSDGQNAVHEALTVKLFFTVFHPRINSPGQRFLLEDVLCCVLVVWMQKFVGIHTRTAMHVNQCFRHCWDLFLELTPAKTWFISFITHKLIHVSHRIQFFLGFPMLLAAVSNIRNVRKIIHLMKLKDAINLIVDFFMLSHVFHCILSDALLLNKPSMMMFKQTNHSHGTSTNSFSELRWKAVNKFINLQVVLRRFSLTLLKIKTTLCIAIGPLICCCHPSAPVRKCAGSWGNHIVLTNEWQNKTWHNWISISHDRQHFALLQSDVQKPVQSSLFPFHRKSIFHFLQFCEHTLHWEPRMRKCHDHPEVQSLAPLRLAHHPDQCWIPQLARHWWQSQSWWQKQPH